MTLMEFMRKTSMVKNGDGYDAVVHKSFKKRHAAAVKAGQTQKTLEAWFVDAPCCGEVLTASVYLSRYNDKFYGQWLMMNVPFSRGPVQVTVDLHVLRVVNHFAL